MTEQLTKCCEPLQKLRVRLGTCKIDLSPPVIYRRYYCCGSHLHIKLLQSRVSYCMALWPPGYNLDVHLALCVLLVMSKLAL